MNGDFKIVDFHEWCPKCKFWKNREDDDPCEECLGYRANLNSTKPMLWAKGKEKKR